MRRVFICQILPLLFCLVPLVGGVLVAIAVPPLAMEFYLNRIRHSYLDWVILTLGIGFFILQLVVSWRAMQWQERGFNERNDLFLQSMYQAAEWFPLLGLFGTVAGILQTFATIGAQEAVPQREIIRLYSPALTTTGSGLLMALINVIPLWMVNVGRRVILSLAVSSPREA